MANKILHKRSLTTGSIPTTSSLLVGEIALNVADGKVYIHKSGSQGQSIESAITSNSTSSIGILTLSGSLILSGSTDINSGSVFDVATDNISFDFDSLAFSGSAEITGSLIVTAGITGSLFGTSSYAENSQTASYALNVISTIGLRVITDDTYITAGSKGFRHIGGNSTITKTHTIANTNGYIDINIKRNGITLGTASLSNQSSSIDTTLPGWTTQLFPDDLIEFHVSQSSVYITDVSIFIDIQST